MDRRTLAGNPAPKATTDSARSTAARLIQLVQAVATGRQTTRTLAESLEVSEKTVLRDLEFLRERVGLDIRHDHVAHTWSFCGFSFKDAIANAAALTVVAGGAR